LKPQAGIRHSLQCTLPFSHTRAASAFSKQKKSSLINAPRETFVLTLLSDSTWSWSWTLDKPAKNERVERADKVEIVEKEKELPQPTSPSKQVFTHSLSLTHSLTH